jgi:hypothetical protein
MFPDSIVVTNKRIILCKPKNLGLSMEFIYYDWDDIEASFVKEGILGADFTFSTKSDLTHTVDYLPKNQARKLYTFAKEQLDLLKHPKVETPIIEQPITVSVIDEPQVVEVEEVITEEVINYAEIIPVEQSGYRDEKQFPDDKSGLAELSQDELFEKLQNYKKLLDNGLILQGEYDNYKKEILSHM